MMAMAVGSQLVDWISYGRRRRQQLHTDIIISAALAVRYCLQHCTSSFLDILYLALQKIEAAARSEQHVLGCTAFRKR